MFYSGSSNYTRMFFQVVRDLYLCSFGDAQVGHQIPYSIPLPKPPPLRSCTTSTLLFNFAPCLSAIRVFPALFLVHGYTQHPSRPATPLFRSQSMCSLSIKSTSTDSSHAARHPQIARHRRLYAPHLISFHHSPRIDNRPPWRKSSTS